MTTEKKELRRAGKGFIVAPVMDGMPSMRRLVESYVGADNKRYIELDDQIMPLLPSHMFMGAN